MSDPRLPSATTSAVNEALMHSTLEKKSSAEENLRQSKERGKKILWDYASNKARASKQKDLFAKIDFGTEQEKSQLLEHADVQAYLQDNPEFEPGQIFALEHSNGIGKIVKGKQSKPDILTLSNFPLMKIDLSLYGLNLGQLLQKYDLPTIKLAYVFVLDGIDISSDSPVISFHLSSGGNAEKEETQAKERALIQEIAIAIHKKHPVVYIGGDGQVNFIKISKDGRKPAVKNGHMEMNENMRKILDGFDGVRLESVKFSEVKFKERHYRENHNILGPSTVSSQTDKYKPDSSSKFVSGVATPLLQQAENKPNSHLLDNYPLPLEGTEDYLATSENVNDHRSVVHEDGRRVTRGFSAGQLQEGPKAFKNAKAMYQPHAQVLDSNGNLIDITREALVAGVEFEKKMYSLTVSNCVRAYLYNPVEVPFVGKPETSLEHLETFYKSITDLGIDPFKSPAEIIAAFDFTNPDQVARLATALKGMGMDPISNLEELKAIFSSPDKAKVRRLCLVLRETGIDPFKTEKEMMSDFDFTDEDKLTKLGDAINLILRVQAVEHSEEKQAAFNSFNSEIRKAFKQSIVQLLKSDEFDHGYHDNASQAHADEHGHKRRGTVPDEYFEKLADIIIDYCNTPSDNLNLSPWPRFFQKAVDMELSGGFYKVARRIPTTEEMRLELCITNAVLFAETRVRNGIFILNITETSTKGLGVESKEQLAGNLYSDTGVAFERFFKDCQTTLLNQKKRRAEPDADASSQSKRTVPYAGNPYSSFPESRKLARELPPARDVSAAYLRERQRMGR